MTLVRVDPETYTITLVSIPRDTVFQGTSLKINDSLLGGDPEEVVASVERLTSVAIEYYMLTTFTSFEALIDALGGVTVDVPKNVTVPDPMTAENVSLKAGRSQSLDGSEALVLTRARKEYGEHQEALRQMNVRNIETAMIQKVLSLNSEKNANAVLVDLEEYTDTNLDMASVGYLLVDFIANREEVTIYSTTGPYAGGENGGVVGRAGGSRCLGRADGCGGRRGGSRGHREAALPLVEAMANRFRFVAMLLCQFVCLGCRMGRCAGVLLRRY